MGKEKELNDQLQNAQTEIAYLKRSVSRLEKRLDRQEKLDDINRHKSKWAMEQLEEARTEAEKANNAKTEFLANMSHEIRTPLNIVLGMGELLADTQLDSTQRQYLQSLRYSGEHLFKLINDILEFSSIESGTVDVEANPFSLKKMLASVEALGSHMAAEKGLQFQLDYDFSLYEHRVGDPKKIKQILLNLIKNGVKYTDSGRVAVRVSRQEGAEEELLTFKVTDTGSGISKEEQGVIFERFTQLQRGNRQSVTGVGLGLAISNRLVQALGGQIEVKSEIGRGSTFSVKLELPLADEHILVQPVLPVIEKRFDFTGMTVLVVDDIEMNFEVVRSFFSHTNVRLDYAENGRKAVEFYAAGSYNAVLMDIRMPYMGGLEAVKNIRRFEELNGCEAVPIIAMTAHAFTEQRKGYLESGFDDVLSKPFSRKELLTVLATHVKQNPWVREYDTSDETAPSGGNSSAAILESVMPKVLDSVQQEMHTIRRALDKNDMEQMDKTCHALKGMVGLYGLTRLSELLESLEASARKQQFGSTSTLIKSIDHYVDELRAGPTKLHT